MTQSLLALEDGLAAGTGAVELSSATRLADEMARHVTRNVGGVRWATRPTASWVLGSKIAIVSGIAAALRLLADGLGTGATAGIEGAIVVEDEIARVVLSAPEATTALYLDTCAALGAYSEGRVGLSTVASTSSVAIVWARRLIAVPPAS